ncbi:AMP-binding enzyme, partial [Bacillus cereus group sp. BC312]
MQGYWQQPEETAHALRDGWLYTGDIAIMHPDGRLRLVDRKKDLILVSGFNVYPNEVEEAIAGLEQVMESAVVGVPDPLTGEQVQA